MEKTPLQTSANARASQRSRERLLVSYTISADIAAEYTETYDIAIGGLAMLTNAGLRRDIEILINLELRDDERPLLRLNGSVRWSTYDPLLEKYRTGVAFINRSAQLECELLRYIDTLHAIRDFGMR